MLCERLLIYLALRLFPLPASPICEHSNQANHLSIYLSIRRSNALPAGRRRAPHSKWRRPNARRARDYIRRLFYRLDERGSALWAPFMGLLRAVWQFCLPLLARWRSTCRGVLAPLLLGLRRPLTADSQQPRNSRANYATIAADSKVALYECARLLAEQTISSHLNDARDTSLYLSPSLSFSLAHPAENKSGGQH